MADKTPRIAIIGTGFSGLCLAIRLKQTGAGEPILLEKAERLGGTWRENTYPGAACDLMSFAYCFSFEQKTDWSRKWSPQPEILDYMDHCAEKYGLLPHVHFGTEVLGANFDEATGTWKLRTRHEGREEVIEADALVSGVGQLHRPVAPDIAGLDEFAGAQFHSAEWRNDVPLAGKRVAVIGNGASAIQFIPEVAREAAHLTVFQRTPNWIIERGDREYTDGEKRRYGRHRWLAKLYRWLIWARQELVFFPVMIGSPRLTKRLEQMARDNMEAHITDPAMRRALTPDYPIGGKRVLIHDDYFPALARDNVSLETSPIVGANAAGLETEDGRRHDFDVVIYSTGFDTNQFLAPMRIEGLEGRVLDQEWKDGAEAFFGLTASGFPNFFMMYGPNTNLGHNSIIFMIECQAEYILQCVRRVAERGLRYLDVDAEAQRAFNAKLHHDLQRTAWAKTASSWYKTAAGKITNNWSGPTIEYWWRTRKVDFRDYHEVA
ncbi:MAG: NAD(P)/FAD-dependent oxidoreductase [Deltaproteobacteria bacterium]|nr:NAD(P)/FAD-dependent oxidoreductase [Deltaproteobacteria bacterium]MBW2444619.1 NAD(P)/FAD-dependent oxidoreductase [Deltaproteobacteria bacterium]